VPVVVMSFSCGFTNDQGRTRHPKYKTEMCRTFWTHGACPYGKRCCFVHEFQGQRSVFVHVLSFYVY
jgi:hypothetical protein